MSEQTLSERVIAFKCHELPGQPMMSHMGTVYLINDLWKEVERLTAELATARESEAAYCELANAAKPFVEQNTTLRTELAEVKAERDAMQSELGNESLPEAMQGLLAECNSLAACRRDAVGLIIRDVCELEPADPDNKRDTLCITVADLRSVLENHLCADIAGSKT